MSDGLLAGEVAIVTGSSGNGTGSEIVRVFAALGARVVVTGRNATSGEAVAHGCRVAGGDAVFVGADLGREQDCERLVAADRSNAQWQNDLQFVIERIGSLSFYFLLAGDFAQAMVALDGEIEALGPSGARVIPFSQLHRQRADTPHIETTLHPGELITALVIPAGPQRPERAARIAPSMAAGTCAG